MDWELSYRCKFKNIIRKSRFYLYNPKWQKIGLELTRFILKNTTGKKKSHAENIQALYRVGHKVVEYFKRNKDIPLSLLIEYYDERKWSANWKEHLDYCYNPTTPVFNINFNELKNLIIQRIESVGVPSWGVNKEYIELGKYAFMITFDRFYEPYTNVRVNSIGLCAEDPYVQLRQEIDKKNHKYTSYLKQCDECHLLIISEDSETGNCVNFSKKTIERVYNSLFSSIYLLNFKSFHCAEINCLYTTRVKRYKKSPKIW